MQTSCGGNGSRFRDRGDSDTSVHDFHTVWPYEFIVRTFPEK